MTYLGEIRRNARPLVAATMGYAVGLQLFTYTSSLFAPHLIAEFGWSKAQFTLMGLAALAMPLWVPIVGRLTDLFGVRHVALVGVLGLPLTFVAFTLMTGSFWVFFAICFVQIFIGTLTNSVVYTRVVAERFTLARGLALTIVTCGPAITGALGTPLLGWIIDRFGWRVGYWSLGAFITLFGLTALLLVPRSLHMRSGEKAAAGIRRFAGSAADYRLVARTPAFWIILAAMMLCTLPTCLHSGAMKLMLLDNHISSATASLMISVYAVGTMAGRLGCGLALDRLPAHVVAWFTMALPAVGYLLLASSLDQTLAIALAMGLVGLSVGAEGDLAPYLVARTFGVQIYSSVMGLVIAGFAIASALGSVILSYTLTISPGFSLFLHGMAVSVAVGSTLFLLLGRLLPARQIEPEPEAEPATA